MLFSSQTFWFARQGWAAYNPDVNGIFIIFTLLSTLRRGAPEGILSRIAAGRVWRVFQTLGQPLRPRTAFWLALCREAGLLNHLQRPTAFAQTWLGWPLEAQILHLFAAWEAAPHNCQERQLRKRLRLRLAQGQALLPSDQRLLPGLESLGLICQERLTLLGKAIFGLAQFPSPTPTQPWHLAGETLVVPYNPNWQLLWKLEAFLTPQAPLAYALDRSALRRAGQRGDPEKFLEILQAGLGTPPPRELRARVLEQPVLQVSCGLVLEFSDPAELRQLRRSEALRSHFERVLSPRHLFIDEKTAPRLLKLLERRGIFSFTPPPNQTGSSSDLGEGPGVGVRPHFSRAPLLEPFGESLPLLQFIQGAIRQQLAFEMRYHAPGGERPEIHRLTPLLIEERGGYTYVIAYSHTRKGQRTYRLDRMEVPGTVPFHSATLRE